MRQIQPGGIADPCSAAVLAQSSATLPQDPEEVANDFGEP